jgi:hypothetical protein
VRAVVGLPGRFLQGFLSDRPLEGIILLDLAVGVGDALAAVGVEFLDALADGLGLLFNGVNALDDVVVGDVGVAAARLHGGEGSARRLLLYHQIGGGLLGRSLVVLLAGAFRTLIALGLGVVVRLEVLLQRRLHPLALQIQKHPYKSITTQRPHHQSHLPHIPRIPHAFPILSCPSPSAKHLCSGEIIMSGEEYTRKIEECRRQLNTLRKDIAYRNEQVARNELTYALDAEIRGQFPQVDDQLAVLRTMLSNFEGKAKELSLMPREL